MQPENWWTSTAQGVPHWEDDQVVSTMFASLPESRPEVFVEKTVEWWKHAISSSISKEHGILVFSPKQIIAHFKHPQLLIYPNSQVVYRVLREMLKRGELRRANTSYTTPSLLETVSKAAWGFVFGKQIEIIEEEDFFLLNEFLKLEGERLISTLVGDNSLPSELIHSSSNLFRLFVSSRSTYALTGGSKMLDVEFRSLISYLAEAGLLVQIDEQWLKVAPSISKKVSPVDECDTAIVSLKRASDVCKSSIRSLNSMKRSSSSVAKIKSLLAKYQNCKELIHKIDSIEINRQVFLAQKGAANALKSSLPDIDDIDDVMSQVQDAVDLHTEIDQALSAEIDASTSIDEDELEKELQILQTDLENAQVDLEESKLPEFPELKTPILQNKNTPLDVVKEEKKRVQIMLS